MSIEELLVSDCLASWAFIPFGSNLLLSLTHRVELDALDLLRFSFSRNRLSPALFLCSLFTLGIECTLPASFAFFLRGKGTLSLIIVYLGSLNVVSGMD